MNERINEWMGKKEEEKKKRVIIGLDSQYLLHLPAYWNMHSNLNDGI